MGARVLINGTRYKRILVAVDGSGTSDLALGEAIKLAKDQQAALRLVHVVDVTVAYMVVEYSITELDKALREAGEMILASRAGTVREAGVDADSKLLVVEKIG
jgi:nucleotide-binding universal stress UspA family protein